jgi:eukaryotic-like serine/threonine-protein kinase
MTDGDRGVIGGRYQVIASLGKGGMGQVYKAYDPILDRTVALKQMLATVVDSEEGRQRFYIEARAAARLNHPNIVTIHELEEYGGDIYIVMELLDGVSLAAFMRQRPDMPLSGYLTIIAQIAEGLHYAHKRAIVHRDIKPPNLVLTTSGNLKILDFGIARLASNDITKKGKLLGTPHYMAPEQVIEEAVDQRADLFSLGAVAYELVTGIKPFSADSIPALLMQITSTPHRPVLEVAPQTEPALAAIIERLLAKDRKARFGTGMELVAALDLIGEIDRVDYVADAVAAVMGPSGEATIYAPIGSTPQPGASTPSSASPPIVPPLFGVTPSSIPASGAPVPTAPPRNVTPAEDDVTPPFGVTPSAVPLPSVPPTSVPRFSVTPTVTPFAKTSPDDATVSLSAPARVPASASPQTPPAAATPAASPDAPTLVDVEALTKPDVTSQTAAGAKTPTASATPPLPGAVAASGVTPHVDLPATPAEPVGEKSSHAAPASNVPLSAPSRAAAPPSIPAPPVAASSVAPPSVIPPAAAASAGAKTPAASAPRGFVDKGVPQARHRSGSGAAIIVIGLLLLPAVVAMGWWAFNSARGALQRGTTATDTTSPSTVKDAVPSAQKPAEQQAAVTDQANQPSQADPNQAKPGETPAATASQEQTPQTPAVEANAATSTEKTPEGQPPARPADANQTAPASQTSQANPTPANPALPANQANASQNPPQDARPTAQPNQANTSQLADARRTPLANQSPGANQPNAIPGDANANPAAVATREPVTDRSRETSPNTVVRDPTRENTRRGAQETPREPQPPQRDSIAENTRKEPAPPVREPAPPTEPTREPSTPSTPADTRSLDYGSLGAFRGGSRSTGSASNVYTDSPSTAAAVARITYALEAYGDAIAARDLDALRDVRSPVTPAEATMLKEGRLTVRFSNLDVSLDGNDARVRCRRAVVANGKTLSSGPSDVRLTRRPDGWVITDIR